MDEFITNQSESFHSKIVLTKFLSFLRIFLLCILSISSFFEDIISCTIKPSTHMLQPLKTSSFSYNSKTHPKTSQMESQINFHFPVYICVLNSQPNCFVTDIERQYFDQFFINQNKWPIYPPFMIPHF